MGRPDSAFLMTAQPAKFQARAFELIRIELGVRVYSPRLNSEVQHLGNLSGGAVQRGPRPLGENFGPSLPIFGDLARSRCLRRARVHLWHLVCTGACETALFHRPSDPALFGIAKPDVPGAAGTACQRSGSRRPATTHRRKPWTVSAGRPPPAPAFTVPPRRDTASPNPIIRTGRVSACAAQICRTGSVPATFVRWIQLTGPHLQPKGSGLYRFHGVTGPQETGKDDPAGLREGRALAPVSDAAPVEAHARSGGEERAPPRDRPRTREDRPGPRPQHPGRLALLRRPVGLAGARDPQPLRLVSCRPRKTTPRAWRRCATTTSSRRAPMAAPG